MLAALVGYIDIGCAMANAEEQCAHGTRRRCDSHRGWTTTCHQNNDDDEGEGGHDKGPRGVFGSTLEPTRAFLYIGSSLEELCSRVITAF